MEERRDRKGFRDGCDGWKGWRDGSDQKDKTAAAAVGTLLVIHTKIPWASPAKNDRRRILGQVEREPLSRVSLVPGSQYPLAEELYAFLARAATMRQSIRLEIHCRWCIFSKRDYY